MHSVSKAHLHAQAMDFSGWLAGQAEQQDLVVLSLDLGSGRDFALLRRLLQDGTLALVDQIYIRWRYQLEVSG